MDISQRNAAALNARVQKLQESFIKRFENVVGLAEIDGTDYNKTALAVAQMEGETAALVRVAEDTLALTRQMKEIWLAGELNTLGKDVGGKEGGAEKEVAEVRRLIEEIAKEGR